MFIDSVRKKQLTFAGNTFRHPPSTLGAAIVCGFVSAWVLIWFNTLVAKLKCDGRLEAAQLHTGCGAWGILFAKEEKYMNKAPPTHLTTSSWEGAHIHRHTGQHRVGQLHHGGHSPSSSTSLVCSASHTRPSSRTWTSPSTAASPTSYHDKDPEPPPARQLPAQVRRHPGGSLYTPAGHRPQRCVAMHTHPSKPASSFFTFRFRLLCMV
ncbi:hypothetical protein B296_00030709 [Ensete ventricosum]|uniref:Ammonium transporter AmtB-like domain-containing protein n=1 Tax=Ensete ventricosum TaxID=4639 RepID=A0A427AI83_ENSVE|nr:hypothetical protein B296_00030709 [Ensete ventricosum]